MTGPAVDFRGQPQVRAVAEIRELAGRHPFIGPGLEALKIFEDGFRAGIGAGIGGCLGGAAAGQQYGREKKRGDGFHGQ
jgi:hypothetical protein